MTRRAGGRLTQGAAGAVSTGRRSVVASRNARWAFPASGMFTTARRRPVALGRARAGEAKPRTPGPPGPGVRPAGPPGTRGM
ncbi:hypothetical protein EV562_107341 [Streptomyces sp. BK208]|nr:hypothetical protein EV562_107341 [Streptomyces sp. BK208]